MGVKEKKEADKQRELVPEGVKGGNWFQRHLNWTIVLTWFAVRLGAVIAIVILGPTMTPEAASAFNGFSFLVSIVVGSIVCGWVLRQKKRSLWWLLLLPVPLGWWVFLLLENRRVEPALATEALVDTEEVLVDTEAKELPTPADDMAVKGFKYVRQDGIILRGDIQLPLTDLPQTVTGTVGKGLGKRRFEASPSQAWAISYATPDARTILEVELREIEKGRHSTSKVVGRKITVLSAKEDFAHPSQLPDKAKLELAAHMAKLATDADSTVSETVKPVEALIQGPADAQTAVSAALALRRGAEATKDEAVRHALQTFAGVLEAVKAGDSYRASVKTAKVASIIANAAKFAAEEVWALYLEKGRELLIEAKKSTAAKPRRRATKA